VLAGAQLPDEPGAEEHPHDQREDPGGEDAEGGVAKDVEDREFAREREEEMVEHQAPSTSGSAIRSRRMPRLAFSRTRSPSRSRARNQSSASAGSSVSRISSTPASRAVRAMVRARGPKATRAETFAAAAARPTSSWPRSSYSPSSSRSPS